MRIKTWILASVLIIILGGIWWMYPYLLYKVSEWQRVFNLELSAALNSLQQHYYQAGFSLTLISFLYGIFHAIGPGHGKFILMSYLSFERTYLSKAIKLTFLSALMQGIVAISLMTLIVVSFELSRSYFNLTLKWIERGSFILMMLFGLYWVYQSYRLSKIRHKQTKLPKILQISPAKQPLTLMKITPLYHSETCGCGHKHLPSANDLAQVTTWKSQLMLVLSIGLRPCSGAILVLFLSYTLDLYLWGVLSALLMALGTGLTLALFAWFVLLSRQQAQKVGKWYLSISNHRRVEQYLKLGIGIIMCIFAFTLLHSSWLDNSQGLLFKR